MRRSLFVVAIMILTLQIGISQGSRMTAALDTAADSTVGVLLASDNGGRTQDVTAPPTQPASSVSFPTNDLAARLDSLERQVARIADVKHTMTEAPPVQPIPPPTAPPKTPERSPSLKVGLLAQVHGQAIQEATSASQDADPSFSRHWQRQVYVRRLRVLVAGDIATNTSFFFESDAPNIGRVESNGTKSSKVQMYVQDAQVQHVVCPEFGVIAGLQLVGITRNSLQSAASLMGLDFGAYQFVTSGALDNNAGRDLGVNLRGFLADERLEYRAGLFSGRNNNLYTPLRFTGRVNYSFADRERGFYYTGTTLGKGHVLSLGGGVDVQGTYRGFAVDGFADLPVGGAGSVTLSAGIALLDGGGTNDDSTMFTALIPRQTNVFVEAGYFFQAANVQPYMKFESQTSGASVMKQIGATEATLDLQNHLRSGSRLGVGVNYFLAGHNTSVKVLYEWLLRNRTTLVAGQYESAVNGQLSVQLQYFTF